jgi:hypothetical protein
LETAQRKYIVKSVKKGKPGDADMSSHEIARNVPKGCSKSGPNELAYKEEARYAGGRQTVNVENGVRTILNSTSRLWRYAKWAKESTRQEKTDRLAGQV